MTRGMPRMGVARALDLREEGFKWREIGVILADEVGRRVPYQAAAVANACEPHRIVRNLVVDAARELNREGRS